MSEARSTLDPIAQITQLPAQGMITLRGDLSLPALQKAAMDVSGCTMPGMREAVFEAAHGLCWMSPDELLLLCPYAEAAGTAWTLTSALDGTHSLVADVSDARALFEVSGAHAREVIAKLAPVDMAPEQFKAPMFRRTRLAQVPAAFWMPAPDTVRIICFQSQAAYVRTLLQTAAQPGSAVEAF